jgi:hypothetical protein
MIKKSNMSNERVWKALLMYRNTQNNNGSSPAQRLMMRQTRNILLLSLSELRISPATNVPQAIEQHRRSTKYFHNKNTTNLPDLQIGDEVYIKRRPDLKDNVEKGQIAAKLSSPHNRKSVGEENVMDGSHLDSSKTPIRPNRQPPERQAALPNCV